MRRLLAAVACLATFGLFASAQAQMLSDEGVFGGQVFSAWDAATVASVTLSNNNYTATNTGTTAINQGAHVGVASSRNATTAAKICVQFNFTTINNSSGSNLGAGFGDIGSSSFSAMGGNATLGAMVYVSGNIWVNGTNTGVSLGARASGDAIAGCLDLANSKVYFRVVSGTPGNWNNSGTADPATNTGGITVPSSRTQWAPYFTAGGTGGVAGNVVTLAPLTLVTTPSGYARGWQ